jgi:hypothetical protein
VRAPRPEPLRSEIPRWRSAPPRCGARPAETVHTCARQEASGNRRGSARTTSVRWTAPQGGSGCGAERGHDFGYRTLAGDSFLFSHRALATGAIGSGRSSLGGTVVARYDGYAGIYDPFSGAVLGAELRASHALGTRARATIAYGAARTDARTTILSYVEQGPRAELRLDLSRALRLSAAAAWTGRRYRSFDAVLAARRNDTYLDASVLAEWDLTPRWTARLSLAARRAGSNVSAFEYSKVFPTFGFAYVIGL